jgi:hypothetical protein
MSEIMDCDELSHEQLQSIESVNDSMEEKAKSIAALIKNMESEETAIDSAINKMEERRNKITRKIQLMADYLKTNLEKCDIKEIKSPWFDIKIKFNPVSVLVSDEKLIPSEYFKEMIMRRLDKTLLSQNLKNNIMIPGVKLERRTRLEIK